METSTIELLTGLLFASFIYGFSFIYVNLKKQ